MTKKNLPIACWGLLTLALSLSALASDTLPYSIRTRPYNGWNSSVRGDIRTIGMGGATVGLGDSFLASTENPSGLAMTLDGADLNFSNNSIQDGNIQNYQNPIYLSSFGVAGNNHPWGFSLGLYNSYQEGQTYILPSNGNKSTFLETNISELRLGLAKLIDIENRTLSLGIALNLGTASEAINSNPQSFSTVGLILSGMYQLPGRLLLGLSYQFPMNYSAPTYLSSPELPGFYQDIKVPNRLVLGAGWIPNRIFRAGLSLGLIGQSIGTALLEDNQIIIGDYMTYQPRLGCSYSFADFSAIDAKAYAGSYLENSRLRDSGRLHATLGVEARFWFVTLGYGADLSTNFLNNTLSFGVDIVRMMSTLDLIPKIPHPPYAGLFPEPFEYSDMGLARPLVDNWLPREKPLDPIKIGLELPARIGKKLEEIKNELQSIGGQPEKEAEGRKVVETKKSKVNTKKLHKKRKKKTPRKLKNKTVKEKN